MFAFLTASIARRLYTLLAVFTLGLGGIVVYQLADLKSNLTEFKRTEIQSVVQSAASLVEDYYKRAQSGELTTEQAQDMAKAALRAIRYQDGEYLFVDSFDYINVVHAKKPEKEGSNRRNEADGRGKLYLAEMIDNAKANGSAYEDYLWEDPAGGFFDKTTYAQAFKPWGWVIASGVLMTTVQSIFNEAAIVSGGITLAIMVAMLVLGFFLVNSITRPLGRLNGGILKVAEGDYQVGIEGIDRRDEIGAMARAVEVFRENGLKVAQMTEAEAARIVSDQRARAQMMGQLQAAFGNVVDAAVAGDFSRRVEVQFPDAELNQLAGSVNNLVETVDGGLAETSRVLGSLARADLTERVTGSYSGAFGQLKDDTNAVADKLGEIVGQLRQTSRALKTATGEILSGANDLSERTTKQAATIEETSAAMEQLASTVLQNAERAREASSVAGSVTRTAEEGGQVMNHANEAMEKIETSSSRISNIIGMIDDIAFQTNLLALNASVEAARAGEAGKGFAVVAVEVRRLAQSAAEASSEVKALIEQSAGEVKTGSRLVADAASKLEAMLTAARSSNELMDGIARESREQASAIEEVNVAVRQMDEMTQHNAALVEETNAAIEQTEAQASELDRIVDIFTIDGEARREAPAPKLQPGKAIPARPAATGIKGLQQRVATAAKAYLTNGNAAIDKDWEEF
ncbi:methyl-accepting chemotaxis protein [Paradevosia shaoguanensis]|uniref:methyl-accepting chemotaxis protein n=1 Tax=Paradevosia shaoguanensis TaxID=1335043 RepID=UPI0019318FDA|nr:methyl-accepting chemotaxis protein [Paradevosia shaoguanensis]